MDDNIYCFSAPGRVELGGNHTDHQNGCVLAAAVELQTRAQVRLNGSRVIHLCSAGYEPVSVSIDELEPRENEKGTSAALVRGVAAGFAARGCPLQGFDAEVRSEVLPGSGLSSSAAFEILLGRIMNGLFFNGRLEPEELAKLGQRAENRYFGKPCGLMDQLASSEGGLLFMDFRESERPLTERIDFSFRKAGYAVCVVDSGCGHEALGAEYGAIPAEMGAAAACFGQSALRFVDENDFYSAIPRLRKTAGDRAVLRAMHFFDENRRAEEQARTLRQGNVEAFLRLAEASGRSSWMLLQNVAMPGDGRRQGLALTLAVCEKLLGGRGAVRVNGGGFAGTALAFVPAEAAESFKRRAEALLGSGCCRILSLAD